MKTYGRGSWLAWLSPLFAILMARQGLNGWQHVASRDMERDAVEMSRKGYRVAAADEYRLGTLGITWFRVTYERD